MKKQKEANRTQPMTPQFVGETIEGIMKGKTPMPSSFSAEWYRSREITFFLKEQFRDHGMDSISVILGILKTSRHPMARTSAAIVLGEIGLDNPIDAQVEETLRHASEHDASPSVREEAKDAFSKVGLRKRLDDITSGKHAAKKTE